VVVRNPVMWLAFIGVGVGNATSKAGRSVASLLPHPSHTDRHSGIARLMVDQARSRVAELPYWESCDRVEASAIVTDKST
jgi:hypothetical protein